MEIGAQLYTVREFCKDTDSLSETLKKVADIGYKNVQVSGICEFDPMWLKNELDKNGLKCVLTHTKKDKIIDCTAQVAKDHDILDCKYVGLGKYGFEEHTVQEFVEVFMSIVKYLNEQNKYFMYHNHDGEFKRENGKVILSALAEVMPADLMGFTLDTFWVQAGGGDPAWWIENLKGRVPCIHLKDFAYGKVMSVIGEGNINFDRVFEKAETAGTQYMLVEQDRCNGENPFDCLKRSYEYLHSLGLK